MSRLVCGCGKVVLKIDDKKDKQYVGICEVCIKNDGDYTKSPYWKDK